MQSTAEIPSERRRVKAFFKWLGVLVVACFGAVVLLLGYWWLRPNRAIVHPGLELEHWVAVSERLQDDVLAHNSNTDLTFWRGHFYLVHASSPWHFASEHCKLIVWRSPDARTWQRRAEFRGAGQDIRDPKFAVVHDRLFMYVLKNVEFAAEPYTTQYTVTSDGAKWTPLQDVQPAGWLFWRPKTRDGETWYVPAYWHEHGKAILLESTDGATWTEVSVICEGDRNDETDIEFLPDGRMVATARLEVSDSYFGHKDACTLIAVAEPPYTEWSRTKSRLTRLDGPCLFTYGGAVYAVGRHNPDPPRFPNHCGSIFGRKRTALYKVEEARLVYVSDLPSAGDTSYAGIVLRDDDLYISYYTSRIDRDYPWILGMVSPTDIRIARVHLPCLASVAETQARTSP